MRITNAGRGIHAREVKGIDRLRAELPSSWYAFTNLDLALDAGRAREIDVILVSDRRIFLIDLKDWHGAISSADGRWYLNGKERDASPVSKISDVARRLVPMLRKHLQKQREPRLGPAPRVEGIVVLTGKADRSGIAETERAKVLTVEEFLATVKDSGREREVFGSVAAEILDCPLTDEYWKSRLIGFFNAGPSSPFKPGRRRFQRFVADEAPTFLHPRGVYAEYNAVEEGTANNLGTVRLWDFTKCDARFQSEEGRLEIAGREQEVYHWLKDRSDEIERSLLTPRIDDPERGVHYWEIYDRRRRMVRLSEFSATEATQLSPTERIELARQALAVLSGLHRHEAAHLDLGGHSIWLESPTTVRLSHLLAARFPEVKSLGKARYQFLASVETPEDVLGADAGPKRRDVFLIGVAIHQLLFGSIPTGNPPEWSEDADERKEFTGLHAWLAEALELDPHRRFVDAQAALTAFNRSTAAGPSITEVMAQLERLRNPVRTQRQLVSKYPLAGEPLEENDRTEVWRSGDGPDAVLVKLWKQPAWGDTRREGSSILSFLNRALDMKADRPIGLPIVKEAYWLGDAFAVVQGWVQGIPLDAYLSSAPNPLSDLETARLVQRIARLIVLIHEKGVNHGDLKPSNIVISDSLEPVLIDALDFSPITDGEISTSAYAPQSGDVFERDRFAVTKISEELLGRSSIAGQELARVARSIALCREQAPQLATLLPLLDECDALVERLEAPPRPALENEPITVAVRGAQTGVIEPDEGALYIRVQKNPYTGRRTIHFTGAAEELEILLDARGEILGGRRRHIEQWRVRKAADFQISTLSRRLEIVRADLNEFSELLPILENPAVRAQLLSGSSDKTHDGSHSDASEEISRGADARASDETAQEVVVEAAAVSRAMLDVDVPRLWKSLMDVENELTIEGLARTDSFFDRAEGAHRVAIEVEFGSLEFSRGDSVGVERLNNKGRWVRIGELDVLLSRPYLVAIRGTDGGLVRGGRLVDEGERLRFTSQFEVMSRRRRTDAVDRILAGNGRSRELVSVFDPRTKCLPDRRSEQIDDALLESYALNPDQLEAFKRILATRPVGLLQGPPGTGKTRFIAALVHYAVTKGIVRNVLIASQAHEAVNTAAEAVLKLFRGSGDQPSLLRVANDEEQVSPALRAFHAPKVERAMKDRFRASFRERMAEVGRVLGLPAEVVADVIQVEEAIRPVISKLQDLSARDELDMARIGGIVETLRGHLAVIRSQVRPAAEVTDWRKFLDSVIEGLIERQSADLGMSRDRLARIYEAARIGRDFAGSVSRTQRSFESFLAGTRQIVAGTCVGLGRSSLGLTNTAFDLVIVDEAARCAASELLVPLQAGRWVVLVGDQAQLEPHHMPEVLLQVSRRTGIPKQEIVRSDFERVFLSEYGAEASASLRTQYRMLEPIGRVVSEAFYPDLKLVAGRSKPEVEPSVLPAHLGAPLVWVETDALGAEGFEMLEESGSSRINRIEATAIMSMIEQWHSEEAFRTWLQTQKKHPFGIGIICMYAAQRDLIRQRLRQSPLAYLLDVHVKVGSVDSYQGKENPIVVLSLVRNNSAGLIQNGRRCIQEGFLATPNRINVAASRAMDRLIVVGARRGWRDGGPMRRFADAFSRQSDSGQALVVDVQDVLEREPDQLKRRTKLKPSAPDPVGGGNG